MSESNEACHSHAEASESYFQLEGAICPPNEFRSVICEHDMHEEVVQVPDPYAEKEKIGDKGFYNDRLTYWSFLEKDGNK